MSSALTTEMSEISNMRGYSTFEGSDHEYEPSRCRSRCYKLAEVTSTFAVPIVTALSWYFLAHDCEDKSNCIKEEMPTFLLASTGSIYTVVKIFRAVANCRRELTSPEEVPLNS